MEASLPAVQLGHVSRHFGERDKKTIALDDVSLSIMPGTFVAIMGATGSGKSTLLNCAAGLERSTSGTVQLLGKDITRMGEARLTRLRRDNLGVVFQSYNLLTELTVTQNVLLPVRLGAKQRRELGEVLAAVGLTGMGHKPVGELSGGQKQRVAIARILVTAPPIIFADEPTGALDPTTGSHIMQLLRSAVTANGHTIVMVTHDPHIAAVTDRLVLLKAGRIVDDRQTPDANTIAKLLADTTARNA
ncbi:MAG TPA: ABC transporter ATP-binding protein [Candidatus Saccharimonadales bacterium]|nr:ABC transporter ATP-binding protein [Candidatus Saccharimonadales bacterium]